MTELLIVLLIVLVLFGAGKIPRIAEDMGKGIKSFKKGLDSGDKEASSEKKESCGCSCSCNSEIDKKIAEAKEKHEKETKTSTED
jgi:sec-independent protein translocase protein TatA